MMIKKIKIGAFGKLKNLDLNLHEGINIVYGENEAGKSTIQAIIKAMLYGLSSQKKNVSENPRKKFIPWNSDKAFAKLYFYDDNNTEYIIERTFGKSKKEDTSMILNAISGEKAAFIDEEAPGKSILGIGEEAFEKTLMISQLNSQVVRGKDDEVMQKLINLRQSGDSSTSYHKAMKKLEDIRKSITNSRRNGKLDESIDKLFNLQQELNEIYSLHHGNIDTILNINKFNEEKKQIEMHIKAVENRKSIVKSNLDFYSQVELKKDTEKRYNDFTRKIEEENEIQKEINKKAKEIVECEEILIEFSAFDKLEENTESKVIFLEEEKRIIEQKLQEIIIYECDIDNYKNQLIKKKDELQNKEASVGFYSKIIIGVGLISLASGMTLGFINHNKFYFLAIVGAISFICGIIMNRGNNNINKEIKTSCLEITIKIKEKERALEDLNSKEFSANLQKNKKVLDYIYNYCGVKTYLEFKEKLFSYREHMKYMHELRGNLYKLKEISSKNKVEIMQMEQKIKDSIVDEIDSEIMSFMDELVTVEKEIRTAESRAQYIFKDKRETSVIKEEIEKIKYKIKIYEDKLAAINIAEKALQESFEELQQSFGPKLNNITGQILSKITGMKYEGVFIGEDYSVKLIEPEDGLIKEISFLSSGTNDQIYLALRLAIAQLIFEDKGNYIIILDDAFLQYDDMRLKNVLDFLSKYSVKIQVILFTCQHREYENLKGICNYVRI
jgi:uncharacterized protein YhaN